MGSLRLSGRGWVHQASCLSGQGYQAALYDYHIVGKDFMEQLQQGFRDSTQKAGSDEKSAKS